MNNKRITITLFITLIIISGFLTLSGFFKKDNKPKEKSKIETSTNKKESDIEDPKDKPVENSSSKNSIKNKVLTKNGVIRVKNIDSDDEKYKELSLVNIENKQDNISDELENELKTKTFNYLKTYTTILNLKEPENRLEKLKGDIEPSYYKELKEQLIAESISPKGYYAYRIPTSIILSDIKKTNDNEIYVIANVTSDWFNSDMELEEGGVDSRVDYSISFKNIDNNWKICMVSETQEAR